MQELNDREHDHGAQWYREVDKLLIDLQKDNMTLWEKVWELERRIDGIQETNNLSDGS